MKKITKALLVVSLAAAANVAMAASSYPSGDSELAGFSAIQGGDARSYADQHQSTRVLPRDGVIPSEDSEMAGFPAIQGGTARSYADKHQSTRVLQGDAAVFPSEDPEVAE